MKSDSILVRNSVFLVIGICFAVAQSVAASTVQDFGQVPVNGSAQSLPVTYSFTGLSAAPIFSLTWARDFQITSPICSTGATTTCSLTIAFSPLRPGLRQDSLKVADSSGNVLGQTPLVGIGLAPLIALYPGVISTQAGSGVWGYQDSPNPGLAMFRDPQGGSLDGNGNLYVADTGNGAVRKIAVSGPVTTVAGTGVDGFGGDGGPATSALLNAPTGVAVDGQGNLFIADQGNNLVRRVDAITQTITTVAGGGTIGSGTDQIGDGGPATSAILDGPQCVAVDQSGNLYIADSFHNLVRVVNAASGIITVMAGGGSSQGNDGFGDGGAAINAGLSDPTGLALDSAGNLYIADAGDNLIRRVDAATGIITAVAGNGVAGYSGDGGLATTATLSSPLGVRVDAANNVYVADFGNSVIRQIDAATQEISTLAGTGATGYSGDGGNPRVALLANPTDLAVDENGNVHVIDYANNVVREVVYSASSMTFPNETTGSTSPTQPVNLVNIGNQALNLSSFALTTNYQISSSGSIDCSQQGDIIPGSTCGIGVSFAPTATGQDNGSLTLTTYSLNQALDIQTISLFGTGLTGNSAAVALNPTALTFGSQLVGTTSAAQTVTVSNTGGSSLSISNISLGGEKLLPHTVGAAIAFVASDYQLSNNTCGASLAAGANCSLSVTFTPTGSGTRVGTVLIRDSAAGSPQTVVLSGTGLSAPIVSLNPTALSFGSLLIGTTSAAQKVMLSNTGSSSLSISNISLGGAQASDYQVFNSTCGRVGVDGISSSLAVSLPAGGHCSLSVRFTPAGSGTRIGTVLISDSAAGSPQSVALSGTGLSAPTASLNATALTFGSQLVGTTSAAQTVTVSNTGGSSLSISNISLGGAQASDYQLSNNACGASLASGANCSFSIKFIPSETGTRLATVLIGDSASDLPQEVVLSGVGVDWHCDSCGVPVRPPLYNLPPY